MSKMYQKNEPDNSGLIFRNEHESLIGNLYQKYAIALMTPLKSG